MKSIKFKAKKIQDSKLFDSEGVVFNHHTNKWAVVIQNSKNPHVKSFKCICQCTTKEQAQINFDNFKNGKSEYK